MRALPSSNAERPPVYAAWHASALASALAEGDEKAFAEVYERYWQPLYGLAYRKLGSGPDAEEIVQDLFVALWQNRRTAHVQQLKAYLFSAVKYKIIDCVRARLTHQGYLAYTTPRQAVADRTTEEGLGAADLAAALAASVGGLPESAREVFRLSREEYRSVPEIALQLNLAPKTVEYHLTRSLRFLRSRLKDFLLVLLVLDWALFGMK